LRFIRFPSFGLKSEKGQAIVHPNPELRTSIGNVPIPKPEPGEIVIKLIIAGSNLKGLLPSVCFYHHSYHHSSNSQTDRAHLTSLNVSLNSKDDIAGLVHSLGSNVQTTN
jgi:hypothetical protein